MNLLDVSALDRERNEVDDQRKPPKEPEKFDVVPFSFEVGVFEHWELCEFILSLKSDHQSV